MPTECKCGRTRCLSCLGTCPVCGDDISSYADNSSDASCRKDRLRRMLGPRGEEEDPANG